MNLFIFKSFSSFSEQPFKYFQHINQLFDANVLWYINHKEIMSNKFVTKVENNQFLCIIYFKSFPEKLKLTSHTLHCIKSVHNEALNPVSHENDQIQTVCEDVDDITSQNKMNWKDDAHFNSPKSSIHEMDRPLASHEVLNCSRNIGS